MGRSKLRAAPFSQDGQLAARVGIENDETMTARACAHIARIARELRVERARLTDSTGIFGAADRAWAKV